MQKLKKKIEDIFLKLLLKQDFHEIEISEIQKKTRISSKKFFQLFKSFWIGFETMYLKII